jgi:hypothetical protein
MERGYEAEDLSRLPSGLEHLVMHFDCENPTTWVSRYYAIRTCSTLKKIVFILSEPPIDCRYRSPSDADFRHMVSARRRA